MMSRSVLVLNSGSSSVKFQLIDPDSGASLADGIVERIGEDASTASLTVGDKEATRDARVADHEAALRTAFDLFEEAGTHLDTVGLIAVGHRVVHGGPDLYQPTLVDDALIGKLEELAPLAPLHNPPAVLGIQVARKALPDLPHIAVFDTAFFHDLPPAAATYAIDRDIAERWHIRRYGFHGTSHQYVSEQAAAFLGAPLDSLRQIVLHLGNGASASAIVGGRPVDTSMGLTPLEGLVMGTRSGDIDPGVFSFMVRNGMTASDVDAALNRESGLKGLSGTNDFREVDQLVAENDPDGRLAFDVTAYRLRKYIGAYAVALGRLDAVVFTAGIGEHAPRLRAAVCHDLGILGVELDEEANLAAGGGERRISTEASAIAVLVIPTNEELEIATQAAALVAGV